MCILLVEDDFLIRLIMAEELAQAGFEVREADNGAAATSLIDEEGERFSLLVTDIHMPGTLDGLDVARHMRAHHPDTPVIYATGRPDALIGLVRLGHKERLIRKPYGPEELVQLARSVLEAC